MPQAVSRSTTNRSPAPASDANAKALRSVLALAGKPPNPPKRDLNQLLVTAWKGHVVNRPDYEKRCAALNSRFYCALKQSGIAKGPGLQNWLAIGKLVTTAMDEAADELDDLTFSRVNEVTEEIRLKSCDDLKDLAALANACAIANHDLWNEPINDLDWEKGFVRHLVEAVLAIADEGNVLAGLPLPQAIEQDAMRRAAEDLENKS
jgi:hypothetical protein